MRLSPGVTLGHYEISGPIGAGGMGEVYRARDGRLGREVAIKVLPAAVAADRERLARFEREARSASALNHPNIVTVHDFAFQDGDCYLVMELVRGESLRDVISRGPLPFRKVVDIAAGIADGLAAAHAAGVVHRDLKPENIMLAADGTPKILDFGLVKAVAGVASGDATAEMVTRDGAVLGTAPYMSPEQIRGENALPQSDQFAFGALLYEMATGRHPFRRATASETLTSILRDDPPPLDASFPEPFVWIVDRLLAKAPSERYGSTLDLAHDLRRIRQGGASPSARPVAEKSRGWRTAFIAAASLAALAVVASLSFFRPWQRTGDTRGPLHVHLATDVVPDYHEIFNSVVISPDGRFLMTQGSRQNGSTELSLTDLRTGEARLFAENAVGAAWSPDSKAVAYFADGKLKTQRIEGGPATIVCDAPPEGTATWHGDTILFFWFSGRPDKSGIHRVPASGGRPELLQTLKKSGLLAWWPQFLPDGKSFLYMNFLETRARQIRHELMLGYLDGRPSKRLRELDSRAVYSAGHLLYVRDGTLLAEPFDLRTARFTGEPRPLVDDVHYFRSIGLASYSVSDNGILAWRTARRPKRLVWLDRTGAELGLIDKAVFKGAGRISRDGATYAAGVVDPKQGVSDIWTFDLARGSSTRRTLEMLDQQMPVWSHDGRTLYYRTDGNGGPPDIFVLEPGGATRPLFAGRSVEQPEDVSPDGRSLLFTTHLLASADVHLLPLDGNGTPRAIVNSAFDEESPRFSPDGKWLTYSSNVSGRSEVYAQPLDGQASAIRISRNGGRSPVWSSRELFFTGPEGEVFGVEWDGTFGAPRMLFQSIDAVSIEPTREGDRFLAQKEERSAAPDVQLLIGWPALLEKGSGER